jgi:hypothetical protein
MRSVVALMHAKSSFIHKKTTVGKFPLVVVRREDAGVLER